MRSSPISIEIPMAFKKRGGRKVIVLPDGSHGHPSPAATIDNVMIKALARAFRWQRMLDDRVYRNNNDIARVERIDPSFVGRTIRLASLAPDIVEAILAGRQPVHLTLKELLGPFPVNWKKQREFFLN
jgi:hypothetical protein